ncbi:MAG: 16S rRNA (guanine(966)-N(2))-methyltransferase RsmD [Candidatus Omnitrophota bacterium]|nr:16S rRNA (guanine(966)-N(2))-methyltransferase RsmD [Candidatus Omnitrophota bacterium]
MRITTGKYRGRIIKMPEGIRPTQEKVRKAVFDILGNIEGVSFLELFAGSGAIGIEALSRGAAEVVFVEKDRRCIRRIEENPMQGEEATLKHFQVLGLDVFKALEQLEKEDKKFDVIFLDPPYYEDMAKKTLQMLAGYDILAPNGLIIVQHFKKDDLADNIEDLTLFKQRRYGNTVLSFYSH